MTPSPWHCGVSSGRVQPFPQGFAGGNGNQARQSDVSERDAAPENRLLDLNPLAASSVLRRRPALLGVNCPTRSVKVPACSARRDCVGSAAEGLCFDSVLDLSGRVTGALFERSFLSEWGGFYRCPSSQGSAAGSVVSR